MQGGMRAVLALLLVVPAAGAEARTVTDSAGRKIELPDRVAVERLSQGQTVCALDYGGA